MQGAALQASFVLFYGFWDEAENWLRFMKMHLKGEEEEEKWAGEWSALSPSGKEHDSDKVQESNSYTLI